MKADSIENIQFRVLNMVDFTNAIGKDRAVVKQVIAAILDTMPAQVERLQTIVNQRDSNNLKNELHNLKGTLGVVGCTSLYAKIIKLESTHPLLQHQNLLELYWLFERVKVYIRELISFSKLEN
jgi:HPt (histidine-containing phosphotransfer) domain-containing protein